MSDAYWFARLPVISSLPPARRRPAARVGGDDLSHSVHDMSSTACMCVQVRHRGDDATSRMLLVVGSSQFSSRKVGGAARPVFK
jgi:hypothetical protein